MQGDTYRLIVRRGPQPNQVYELTEDVVNLGRDITNNITINDREVSRHHLRFTRGAEGYTIEDLGSTNGTFINGRRVSGATLLKNGDMIGLGETVTLGYEAVRAGMSPGVASYQPPAQQQPPAPQAPQPSPYQPPAQQQAPQPAPYQPPAQQQPQPAPYQPPAQQQPPQQPYQPQAADPYAQPAGSYPTQDPYAQQQQYPQDPYNQAYNPPPPPGYGYDQHDPFGMREEEGSNTTRVILIGCVALMVICCCCTLVGIVAIDQLCLYERVPLLPEILRALGIGVKCGA